MKIYRPAVQDLWKEPHSHSDCKGTWEQKCTARWYWTGKQLAKILPALLSKEADKWDKGSLLEGSVKPVKDPMIEMITNKAIHSIDTTLILAFTIRNMSDVAQIKDSDTGEIMAVKAFEEWGKCANSGKAAFDQARSDANIFENRHLNNHRAMAQQQISNAMDYCWTNLHGTSFSAHVRHLQTFQSQVDMNRC